MDEQKLRKILKEELKEELKSTEDRLQQIIEKEVGDLSAQIVEVSQKLDTKADKTETLSLHVRVNKLEEKVFPQL